MLVYHIYGRFEVSTAAQRKHHGSVPALGRRPKSTAEGSRHYASCRFISLTYVFLTGRIERLFGPRRRRMRKTRGHPQIFSLVNLFLQYNISAARRRGVRAVDILTTIFNQTADTQVPAEMFYEPH